MGISDVSYHKVAISGRNMLFCQIKAMFVSQFDNKYIPLCAIEITDKPKKERNHNESTDKARRI